MRAPKSIADRIGLLLDWLNSEAPVPDQIRGSREHLIHRLDLFIRSFDGSAASAFVVAQVIDGAHPMIFTDDELAHLHTRLRMLLHAGFRPEPGYASIESGADLVPISSLRLGIKRVAPFGARSRERTGLARHSGTYVMKVGGARVDLAYFLFSYLLTVPGAIAIGRCRAPAPHSLTARCGKFLIGTGQGRPRLFCSNTCRIRNHSREIDEEIRQPIRRGRKRNA